MPASSPHNTARTTSTRLDSIDLLRGAIMILMSLDHVRDYFTHLRFTPEDITQTWTALFVTRWVTHFCAPLFFLLAGLAAFLSSTRGRSAREIRHVLWTRGLWLVLLELPVVGFAWSFLPGWSFGGVIWALGWSMVILSFLVRLPVRWIAVVSVATILLHNLLDPIRPEHLGAIGPIWGLLHVPNFDRAGLRHVVRRLRARAVVCGHGRRLRPGSSVPDGCREAAARAHNHRPECDCVVRSASGDESLWKSRAAGDGCLTR